MPKTGEQWRTIGRRTVIGEFKLCQIGLKTWYFCMGFGKTIDDRQNNPESMYGGVYYRDRLHRLINTWVKHVKLFKFSFNINITLICYISQKKKKRRIYYYENESFLRLCLCVKNYFYIQKTLSAFVLIGVF